MTSKPSILHVQNQRPVAQAVPVNTLNGKSAQHNDKKMTLGEINIYLAFLKLFSLTSSTFTGYIPLPKLVTGDEWP